MTITKDGLKNLIEAVKELPIKQVLVGIPAEKDSRPGEPIGNAGIAYVQDKGSPVRNIPARPFLEKGVKKVQLKTIAEMRVGVKAMLDGGKGAVEKSLNRAGIIASNSVKATIKDGDGFAPLSPRTLAARKRKGFKGEKPLIESAQMLNAVTYVIREKK